MSEFPQFYDHRDKNLKLKGVHKEYALPEITENMKNRTGSKCKLVGEINFQFLKRVRGRLIIWVRLNPTQLRNRKNFLLKRKRRRQNCMKKCQ